MPRRCQVFQCEGDYWTIVFDDRTVRLRDAKGLQYLAILLRRPAERIDVAELVTSVGRPHKGSTRQRHGVHSRAPTAAQSDGADVRKEMLVAERARVSVTKAIRSALLRIAEVHPTLGTHLAATVRRGRACSYTPDPRHPGSWDP